MTGDNAPVLATIGYDGLAPDDFIRLLRQAGVARVVDVRALAASRKPGYAKRALTEQLAAAGIGYLHLPALGTPKAGREANKAGRMAEFRRIYAERLATPEAQEALARLGTMAREEPLCLLCLEAHPADCHRTLVAEALAMPYGLRILHLERTP
jgi:uncharacterized protein (DUF488 family)